MRKLSFGAIVGGALLFAGVASAGYKYLAGNGYVTLVKNADGSGSAHGAIGFVRASPDSNQEIGCYSYPTSSMCVAYDATNRFISCSTTDPAMMALTRSITPDSYISFNVNASGQCSTMLVYNDSGYPPKSL